jgi:hypothetical protein
VTVEAPASATTRVKGRNEVWGIFMDCLLWLWPGSARGWLIVFVVSFSAMFVNPDTSET